MYYGCYGNNDPTLVPRILIASCTSDPCEDLVCEKYPQAKCFRNVCVACNGIWWIGDTTVECETHPKKQRRDQSRRATFPARTKSPAYYTTKIKGRTSYDVVTVKPSSFLYSIKRAANSKNPTKQETLHKSKDRSFYLPYIKKTSNAQTKFARELDGRVNEVYQDKQPYQVYFNRPQLKRKPFFNINLSLEVANPSISSSQEVISDAKLYFGCFEEPSDFPLTLRLNRSRVIKFCQVDPCLSAPKTCENYPHAECYANICEECKQLWWIRDTLIEDCTGLLIKSNAVVIRAPFVKPVGLHDHKLFHGCANVDEVLDCSSSPGWYDACASPNDPATQKEAALGCLNYPNAECYPNACGICGVKYWFWGNVVNCSEPMGEFKIRKTFDGFSEPYCPDGYTCDCPAFSENVVNNPPSSVARRRDLDNVQYGGPVSEKSTFCFYDPCSVSPCFKFPDAKCLSDNCGGSCNANFYLEFPNIDDTGHYTVRVECQ
ncbi:unnamed protein product [Gordionus sp. m RMFG-2023]